MTIRCRSEGTPLSNLAPLIIGLLIVGIGIALGINAGWAINPARDLGPRLFGWLGGWPAWRDQAGALYWWVPIVGPLIRGGAYIYDFGIHQFATPVPEPGQEVQSRGLARGGPTCSLAGHRFSCGGWIA